MKHVLESVVSALLGIVFSVSVVMLFMGPLWLGKYLESHTITTLGFIWFLNLCVIAMYKIHKAE